MSSMTTIPTIRPTYAIYEDNGVKFRLQVHFWQFKDTEYTESIRAIVFKPSDGLVPAHMLPGYKGLEEGED